MKSLVWPHYITDFSIGSHPGRSRGPFVNAVTMGRMLIITFLCTLLIAIERIGIKKFILSVFMLLSTVSIYFTYTRGPWLGFAICIFIMLIKRNKARRLTALICIFISLGMIIGVGSKLSLTENTLFSRRQSTVEGRLVGWITALKMANDNPLFGVGFGRYNSEWENYYSEVKGLTLKSFDGNHNTPLGILAECGYIGLFFYLIIFYLILKYCLYTFKSLDDNQQFEKTLVLLIISIEVMYLFTGIFSDLRWNSIESVVSFYFFGLASSMNKAINNPKSEIEKRDLKIT